MPTWLTGLGWADWWAAVQGSALVLTVLLAAYQVRRLRIDQRGWETLKICEKYDTDFVIDRALNKIRRGRNNSDFEANPKNYSFEIRTVGNYFEGIATGIRQGFYNEAVVRDHLENIMREFGEEFLYQPRLRNMGIERDEFSRTLEMLARWQLDKTYYKYWSER